MVNDTKTMVHEMEIQDELCNNLRNPHGKLVLVGGSGFSESAMEPCWLELLIETAQTALFFILCYSFSDIYFYYCFQTLGLGYIT